MSTVKIEKDVFVRDQYNVRRRVFVAGTEVEEHKYNAVVKPEEVKPKVEVMENKMLPEPEKVKEVEAISIEEIHEEKPAKAPAKAKK